MNKCSTFFLGFQRPENWKYDKKKCVTFLASFNLIFPWWLLVKIKVLTFPLFTNSLSIVGNMLFILQKDLFIGIDKTIKNKICLTKCTTYFMFLAVSSHSITSFTRFIVEGVYRIFSEWRELKKHTTKKLNYIISYLQKIPIRCLKLNDF